MFSGLRRNQPPVQPPTREEALLKSFPPALLPVLGTDARFMTNKVSEFMLLKHGDSQLAKFTDGTAPLRLKRGGIAMISINHQSTTSSQAIDSTLWFTTEPRSDGQMLKDAYSKTVSFLRYPSLISHAIFDMEPPLATKETLPFEMIQFFSFPLTGMSTTKTIGICDLPHLGPGVSLKAVFHGRMYEHKERRGLEIFLVLPQLPSAKYPVIAYIAPDGGRIVVAEGVDVALILLIYMSVSSLMDEVNREKQQAAAIDVDIMWKGVFSSYVWQ